MTAKWNVNDPSQREAALQFLYSLPDDDANSDVEADDGAYEELVILDNTNIVNTVSGETLQTDGDNNEITPPVFVGDQSREIESEDEASDEEEEEDWGYNTKPFEDVQCSSISYGKPKLDIPQTAKESVFFEVLFDENILQKLVFETNLYASQKTKPQPVDTPSASSYSWTDTNVEEIKAFIGCLIVMGIHQLPHLKNYWSSDPALGVPFISEVMSARRFKKLVENIHCNDNTTNTPRDQAGHDKLHKLRPLITGLNKNIMKVYDSSSFLCVDESMIPFKGRSSFKQYMPAKPVKRGYKVWCLADSKVGYVMNFEIYTGKTNASDSTVQTLGEKVVTTLVKCVENSKKLVVFDNFFTSYKLMIVLHSKGLYSCGTVRCNRKGLPSFLKEKAKLQRGEFQFETKGRVAAVKWMDNKAVTLLSTAHNPKDTAVVARRNKDGTRVDVPCPLVVEQYNANMGGVDRFDQLRERYAIGRRSVKWWHRILYFLIDLVIVNSFLLWTTSKRQSGNYDQLTFRLRLARQLIGGYSSRKRRGRPIYFKGKQSVPDEVRLVHVGKHLPNQVLKYRRCRMCSNKGTEKRTRFVCSGCNVPLCVDPCFKKFHGK